MAEVCKPEPPFRCGMQWPGSLRDVGPAPLLQPNSRHTACSSAGCDARTRTHTAVSHPHCRTPGDALPASHQRTGVYHVENFPLILQKDPCRQVPDCAGSPEGTDTPPSGCRIEPGVNQQFLLWIFFFFFNATFQPFLLIWENRFLPSLAAMTPLVHVLSYVKNISILCCNTQYY